MVYFKSIINGIGTGAGVAWPMFGIVFSVVGASIGGLVSFALGGVAIALFMMISTAIFYLSYQKAQEEEQRSQTLLQKNEQKLMEFVNEYIYNIYKSYQLTAKTIPFKAFLSSQLDQQLSAIAKDEKKTPLYQSLKLIKILIEQQLLKEKSILPIIEQKIIQQYSVPYSNVIIPIFYAFVGTFGSIAGCSAGISGLLTGLGLFSSFAAFPILGWGILGFAISMGIFAANNAISETQETSKNELLNQTVKKMYQHLKSQVLDLPLNLFHHPSNPTPNKSSRNFPSLFLSEDESVINSWVSKSDALQHIPLSI
ncbi:TPA: hypothetical protein ACTUT5_003359 [Legionella anisa]|uniref:hypothetical protein n=1 Tax=Legionella anisa TaxID=28082 RepID=UPI0019818C15|nr:hypothetical protein [Legionella anisa]MBN5937313.1 hypothetical protein [Legionella anisa]